MLPSTITYSLQTTVCSALETIQEEQKRLGFFILATNQLDAKAFPIAEVLNKYKGQNQVERSFKFLKFYSKLMPKESYRGSEI